MTAASLVKGWCPGALRPMESGDGLLLRIRITGGILSSQHAQIIATAAMQYGNGLIDLSSRANLQIRGVSRTQWPQLIADLSRHGLIDDDAEAEAVRNVMASPLAGLDPSAQLDIRPIVRALEKSLVSDRALHQLPGKFGFSIDDGGQFSIVEQRADIAFEAIHDTGSPAFAVRIGNDETVGKIGIAEVCDTATALAMAFIKGSEKADKPFKRMDNLVSKVGAENLFKATGILQTLKRPKPKLVLAPFGFHALGESGFLGIGAPFGRWSANSLAALAEVATKEGSGDLRLTPWRSILLPALSLTAARALCETAGADFITDSSDPRLSIAACPGTPACGNASVRTHEDALLMTDLEGLLRTSGTRLHVSGCEKGCARPTATKAVLVGRNGQYDLVLDGKASDRPFKTGLNAAMARLALEELWAGGAD